MQSSGLEFSRVCRRRGLAGILAAVLSAGTVAAAEDPPATPSERPNILFIFSDDHAPNAIGAYDGWLKEVNPTPSIDRLASQGMLFRNSFCSNSICAPSRAVILTGLHSHRNGLRVNGDEFDAAQRTFPKLLQQAGYQTAMIGKWHLRTDPTGFDYWRVLPGQGAYYNPDFRTPGGRERIEGYTTDIITDLAIDWLSAQRDRDRPFLLMCQHKGPHRNWMPPERHLGLYAERDMPEPPTLFDEWLDNASPARHQEMEIADHMIMGYDLFVIPDDGWGVGGEAGDAHGRAADGNAANAGGDGAEDDDGAPEPALRVLKRMNQAQRAAWRRAFVPRNSAFRAAGLEGRELVRWKYQRYIKNYLRTVRAVDESVGRLMQYLEQSGLADNTVVIYSSDQGFYLGEHGWYDKRWMYEESLAMPLIVRWPGVTAAGSASDALVQNLDYASTFLEMAGVTPPADMQGRSLVPLLRGAAPGDWREAIYYHYYEYPSVHMVARHYGIRTQRYKLMHFYQFGEWEFYDLERDPDERRNVYDDPQYADEIARLKDELRRLRTHYGDDSDVSEMPEAWQQEVRGEGP